MNFDPYSYIHVLNLINISLYSIDYSVYCKKIDSIQFFYYLVMYDSKNNHTQKYKKKFKGQNRLVAFNKMFSITIWEFLPFVFGHIL